MFADELQTHWRSGFPYELGENKLAITRRAGNDRKVDKGCTETNHNVCKVLPQAGGDHQFQIGRAN